MHSNERRFLISRLNDICDNILANDYDIVCLQEVWMEEHKNEIVAQLNMKYSFYAWFPSGTQAEFFNHFCIPQDLINGPFSTY